MGEVTQALGSTVERTVDRARSIASEVSEVNAQDMAREEFSKLSAWEYHVERIFLPTSQQDLAIRLNELGKENWECGSPVIGLTEPSPSAITTAQAETGRLAEPVALVTCKRRPKTVLRMVPRLVP